jgi:hypothetical protein
MPSVSTARISATPHARSVPAITTAPGVIRAGSLAWRVSDQPKPSSSLLKSSHRSRRRGLVTVPPGGTDSDTPDATYRGYDAQARRDPRAPCRSEAPVEAVVLPVIHATARRKSTGLNGTPNTSSTRFGFGCGRASGGAVRSTGALVSMTTRDCCRMRSTVLCGNGADSRAPHLRRRGIQFRPELT